MPTPEQLRDPANASPGGDASPGVSVSRGSWIVIDLDDDLPGKAWAVELDERDEPGECDRATSTAATPASASDGTGDHPSRSPRRQPGRHPFARLLVLLLVVVAAAETVFAPAPTHSGPPRAIGELPTALASPSQSVVPRSLQELREIEDHIARLVPGVKDVTVGVQVGPAFGSGVVVNGEGLIMTAGHVSGRPGQAAKVTFSNGRTFTGRTLGQNRNIDTGLIQLDSRFSDWPHAEMAPDGAGETGDWVLALGHPGGVQAGRDVVVRLGRIISTADERFVQTDCELVGGDSGGPLFDMQGRVIAINSRIGADTDWNLHVPVAKFRDDWDRLLASESFIEDSGAVLGLDTRLTSQGVVVEEVYEGYPADRAGLQAGDLLLRFQGELVVDEAQLKELVGTEPPGTRVRMVVDRVDENGGHELLRFTVKLGRRRSTS